MNLGQYIIIGISIFLGLWYIVGSAINRKRGIATYHWLREKLGTAGEITEAKWIGSSGSGARLTVGKANRPFQRVEVVFLLDSREIMPLYLFNLLRNKHDEMILKANLRSLPSGEIEIGRPGTKDLKTFLSGNETTPFSFENNIGGLDMLTRGKQNESQTTQLKAFIEKYNPALMRISLQREMPHLILRLSLPPMREEGYEGFFEDLKAWLTV